MIAHLNHLLNLSIKRKHKFLKIKIKIEKFSNKIFIQMEEIIFPIFLAANHNNKLKIYKQIKNDYLL